MKPRHKDQSKDFETSLYQQLIFKFLPYWYLFIIGIAISLLLGFLYIKKTPPVYESRASLLIKDQNRGIEDSKIEEALNVFGSKNVVENEVEILHSNALLQEVSKNLNLYAQIYTETGWRNIIKRSAYELSPVIAEIENPELITKSAKHYFTVSKDQKTVFFDGKNLQLGQYIEIANGKLRFLPNPNFSPVLAARAEGTTFLLSITPLNQVVSELGKNFVSKQANKQSTVVLMTMKDEVPKRGEKLITEIVNEYNEANLRKKNEVANNTLRFLEGKLNVISAELDSVEKSVQSYRTSQGIVDISEQSRQYLESIQQNDQDLNKLKIQSQVMDEVQSYLNTRSSEGSIAPSTFNIQDQNLSMMLERLYTTEAQYEKLRKTTAENNPILQSMQSEIAQMRATINENVNNQKKSIDAGKTYLSSVNRRYNSMLNSIPSKERQLVEVSRQLNIKKQIYAFLLQKKEEVEYSLNATVPQSFIVDIPMSSQFPVSPNKMFVMVLSLIVPISLCIVLISLKETLNGSVLYRREIEKMTSFPIIGEVIFERLDNNIIAMNSQRRFFKEQFRQIRTALRSFSKNKILKRILVTSSIQGEGKSFVAANLAISLANSGKRVALLEMDLYKPKIHNMFQMVPQSGITDFLQKNTDVDNILVSTEIQNLTVVPAGNLDDSPSELLLNDRLESLLNTLDGMFDILVIDSPPVKPITDAFEIARHTDLVVYVIRHNFTPKAHIQILDEELFSHQIRKVAIIFNGIKRRGAGRYSYGYGYGYGNDDRVRYDEYGKNKAKRRMFT